MTSIYIGYNEKFLYDALVLLYSEQSNIEVVGGSEIYHLETGINKIEFDILLLELGHVNLKVVEFIKNMRQVFPEKPMIIFSSKIPSHTVCSILEAQPNGFILKSCSVEDLINATNKVIEGSKYFCHKITQLLYTDFQDAKNHENHKLTTREEEILVSLVNGETNFNIANDLEISETTVKTHRRNIMQKLGATNTFALVRYACREHLIDRSKADFCKGCPCSS